jgi:chemotaxis protein methyltransferase CheR
VDGKTILFHEELRRRMVFSPHNLAADKSFNEFNLILCRNVLIYFNSGLQNRVIRLFADSLPAGGLLALGSKEGIDVTYFKDEFEACEQKETHLAKKMSACYFQKRNQNRSIVL